MYNNRNRLLYFKKCRIGALSWLLVSLLGVFLLPSGLLAAAITPEYIIDLVNRERDTRGLAPLVFNGQLISAARDKARSVFANQVFAHDLDGRKFSAWIKDAGYRYTYVGENLALDFTTSEGAMKAWMASPSHEKNVLNPLFSETGIAVLNGDFKNGPTTLIVQIFGSPAAATGLTVPLNSTDDRNSAIIKPADKNADTEEKNITAPVYPSNGRPPGIVLSSPAFIIGNDQDPWGRGTGYAKYRFRAKNIAEQIFQQAGGIFGENSNGNYMSLMSVLILCLLIMSTRDRPYSRLAPSENKAE